MILSISINNTELDIIAVVQKSAFAWALDRNNGNLIWSTVSWFHILKVSTQFEDLFPLL